MYRITVDRLKRLVRFESIGYPEPGEVSRFDEDIRARVRELRASGPHFCLLADIRNIAVIGQNDTALVSEQMQWLVDNGLRKSATLVASTLQQMQVNRMAANPVFRCFTSEQEALDWLMS